MGKEVSLKKVPLRAHGPVIVPALLWRSTQLREQGTLSWQVSWARLEWPGLHHTLQAESMKHPWYPGRPAGWVWTREKRAWTLSACRVTIGRAACKHIAGCFRCDDNRESFKNIGRQELLSSDRPHRRARPAVRRPVITCGCDVQRRDSDGLWGGRVVRTSKVTDARSCTMLSWH
ncbi:hypothetical protein M011DRAFT_131318 [Sporormia fimetaria CBS 119925]|uniref:Uncharacterized protein n=1 Tax=Sporormia fimetaria CBS 119925 TaxID=1340428 RepID=A0A6A6V4V1_9PLEO|nr:hypothetical protein M011DRAFT_131318 [Sporormia fimetaria CBS 119925]